MSVNMKFLSLHVDDSVKSRFWQCVVKGRENECWLWKGTRLALPNDYGVFHSNGKTWGAHVMSYIIHNGLNNVPDLDILHSCDVKACVNPAHLREGTHTENIIQAVLDWKMSVLHPFQAVCIRQLALCGIRQQTIANWFKINQSQVSRIKNRQRWSCMTGGYA